MVALEPLITADQLKSTRLSSLAGSHHQPYSIVYDSEFDALYIFLIEPHEDTVILYAADHIGVIYEAESLEMVGLQIEAFERAFLPSHAAVQAVWQISDAGLQVQNLGDLAAAVSQRQPQVVREVVKATRQWLGSQGERVSAVFG